MDTAVESSEWAKPVKPRKRRPSDDLGIRRGLMRRFSGGDIPTIAQLEKHAERFGTDHVVVTAAELGYGLDACVRLQDTCDRIDAAIDRARRYSRRGKIAPAEDRVRVILGLEDDGGD
jgi:hypothetical protein